MELFIRISNGEPIGHPIIGENFRQAHPNIDTNNLPPEYSKFERILPPILGPYEKNQRVQYELGTDGIYRDVWYCDQMTSEEITSKQNETKDYWALHGYPSWIFDEVSCSFQPPVPYPSDGNNYIWDESIISWVEDNL